MGKSVLVFGIIYVIIVVIMTIIFLLGMERAKKMIMMVGTLVLAIATIAFAIFLVVVFKNPV